MNNLSHRNMKILALAACCLGAAGNSSDRLILEVEEKVQQALPTKAEKRFDEIGWAQDIRGAERLAKQRHRPILLFTHDGQISTGRC